MSFRLNLLFRRFSQSTTRGPSVSGTKIKSSSAPPPSSSEGQINADVPGLSSNIVKPTSDPVGPGASTCGEYKVPEYFSYNRMSYHEAEVEMAKYRCPQPSALKK